MVAVSEGDAGAAGMFGGASDDGLFADGDELPPRLGGWPLGCWLVVERCWLGPRPKLRLEFISSAILRAVKYFFVLLVYTSPSSGSGPSSSRSWLSWLVGGGGGMAAAMVWGGSGFDAFASSSGTNLMIFIVALPWCRGVGVVGLRSEICESRILTRR